MTSLLQSACACRESLQGLQPRRIYGIYRVCNGFFEGGLQVGSGTVQWYGSSSGTDFDNSETASPDLGFGFVRRRGLKALLGFAAQPGIFRMEHLLWSDIPQPQCLGSPSI